MDANEKISIESAIKFLEKNEIVNCHAVLQHMLDEREQTIDNLFKEKQKLEEELKKYREST